MVALACKMRTAVDPQSKIRRTIYGMDGIAPGFLRERRSWEDHIPTEEDEAGTSGDGGGSETGTWKTVDDDGRFPSLVDLFLHHGGSLETVEELIRGVKARADQEMENWCHDRIRIRASTDPSEPNIFLDDRKEAEKWEHVEELRLWMKHTVGLLSDVVNNVLGPAYFVSIFSVLNLYRTFGFVFQLLDRQLAGPEGDFSHQVELHPLHVRRLAAAPHPQGQTPGVTGEAPQGLQRSFGA